MFYLVRKCLRAGCFAVVMGLVAPRLYGGSASTDSTPSPQALSYPMVNRIEFKAASVHSATRLLAEVTGLNIVATQAAGRKTVTLFLQNVDAKEAIDTLCRISGLWYRQTSPTGQTFRLMTTQEYSKDLVVYRQDLMKVFPLLHPNPAMVARTISDLYGERVILSFGLDSDDPLFEEDLINAVGTGSGGGRRSISSSSGRSRSGGSSGNRSGRRSRRGRREPDSNRFLTGQLTADQIASLEQRISERPLRQGEAATGVLDGLTRIEPDIFISVVRQHNLLVVRTSDARAVADIEALIKELDRPTPQILLEVKILEVTLGDDYRSIFDLDYTVGPDESGPASDQIRNPLAPLSATGVQNILGLGSFNLEPSTFVYQFLNDHIRARIQLLDSENRIDTVSSPILFASNNRPSRLFVGEERPITTGFETHTITPDNGATTTNITPITEVRDIGNTITILPKINADGTVTLSIIQDVSTVVENGGQLLVGDGTGGVQEVRIDTVNTTTLELTVVAKTGLTVAVGGLIRHSISDQLDKVPVLGDMPVLGVLFRREVRTRLKTELVMLITPHILRNVEEAERVTREVVAKDSQSIYFREGSSGLERYFEDIPPHPEPEHFFDSPKAPPAGRTSR